MRHQVRGRHLNRTSSHRKALKRNLVSALFEHGRIKTTDAKAREVRPLAERMITLAKRGDLHARRLAVRVIGNGPALERLFDTIAGRFAERPGGYTRMIKAGRRLGDSAPVAYLELLDEAPRAARPPADEQRDKPRTRFGRRKAAAQDADEEGSGRRRKPRVAPAKSGAPRSKAAGASAEGRDAPPSRGRRKRKSEES